MKSQRQSINGFVAALLILPAIQAYAKPPSATTIRPIEDFVERQGRFCIDTNFDGGYENTIVDGNFVGNCSTGAPPLLFVPPIANFIGTSDPEEQRLASVDYAGLADAWSGGELGTSFEGRVTERPLADGRALVTVLLSTDNALTWVVDDSGGTGDFNGPLLFGNRAPQVVTDGAEPALGSLSMRIKFLNTAPGDPLPDVIQLLAFPEPGQELLSLQVTNQAKGPLTELFGVPERTLGLEIGVQVWLQTNPNCGADSPSAVADCFPAEKIDLHVIGQ